MNLIDFHVWWQDPRTSILFGAFAVMTGLACVGAITLMCLKPLVQPTAEARVDAEPDDCGLENDLIVIQRAITTAGKEAEEALNRALDMMYQVECALRNGNYASVNPGRAMAVQEILMDSHRQVELLIPHVFTIARSAEGRIDSAILMAGRSRTLEEAAHA